MIDFGLLGGGGGGAPVIEPRKIFTTLARDPKFKRPSDVQADVLDQWFDRRSDRTLTLKMNTGGGKTLVGLLILQSCLNEGTRPAVYITPNKFLTEQVLEEAQMLGVPAVADETELAFVRGDAILVANIFKVVNGGSAFGVGRKKIAIGALVVDDAHACLSVIEDQFRFSFDSSHPVFSRLLDLFLPALREYDTFRSHDVARGDPSALVEVPFWLWQQHVQDVYEILQAAASTEKDVFFKLKLVDKSLPLAQCVFTGTKVEFAPRCTPLAIIPSFNDAARRVLMTATLANDGLLVTHLGADARSVSSPIAPKTSDIGSRLILTPQELNKKYTDDDLRSLATTVAKDRNVVVIVPSGKRVEFWRPVANQILDTNTVVGGVAALKKGHVGLTVLVNRYDGIDLPGKACELLILDGLPAAAGPIKRRRDDVLDGSSSLLVEQVQRIEQGMGRGVRTADDQCVVVLFGSDLTKVVNFPDTFDRFTPVTRAQFELSRNLAKQIKGTSQAELLDVMSYSFVADPQWQLASKTAIAKADSTIAAFVPPYVEAERAAFDWAYMGQFQKAVDALKPSADTEDDSYLKGVLKQQLAEYTNQFDKVSAQEILLSAVVANSAVLKPLKGVQHVRTKAHQDQARASRDFFTRFNTPAKVVVWAHDLLDRLTFDPERTDQFEQAIKELGDALGLGSSRPEKETGKGPDNLWALGDSAYAIIEAKTGATSPDISKSDCNQLLGSMSWFKSQYPEFVGDPVMVHHSISFSDQASPGDSIRIIDKDSLASLKTAFEKFCEAISPMDTKTDATKIGAQLLIHKLTGSQIITSYSKVPFGK